MQPHPAPTSFSQSLRRWAWVIARNLLGWVFILSSFIIGPAVPGPGGIPLFLLGFALISVPGKRRIAVRVLRGIPIEAHSRAYLLTNLATGITLGALLAGWIAIFHIELYDPPWQNYVIQWSLAIPVILLLLHYPIRRILNVIMRMAPRVRRAIRPWMRDRGIRLLPPRRRASHRHAARDELVEIHPRHFQRLYRFWIALRPWLLRAVRLVVIGGVFYWMLRPVFRATPDVRAQLLATPLWQFAVAALMFSVFLFAFRAVAWRALLAAMGSRLPLAPAVRIWSMSELARYLPGVIWQVAGRVYLVRPYGVSGSVSSASQILELALFMLANIIVALACLLAAGLRKIPPDERLWLYLAMGFVPLLLTLVHPRIFFSAFGWILRRLGKQRSFERLHKRAIAAFLGWTIFGLLWQSLAVWLLTHSVLQLPIDKWYVLAGCYCLAWTMGFSVGFLAPGGIGIREYVFIVTLRFFLPPQWVAQHFPDDATLQAFLGFLGVLLRLWAIAGELTFSLIANLCDRRRLT